METLTNKWWGYEQTNNKEIHQSHGTDQYLSLKSGHQSTNDGCIEQLDEYVYQTYEICIDGDNEETINKHHIYEDGCAVRIFGGKLSPVKQSSWLQTWSFGSYVWFFACIGKTLQFADEIVTWNTDQGNAWHWKAVRSDTKYWSNMTRVWKRGESTPELWPFCWFGKMM